ncbi:MAG: adenine phosphoribosyltransferase [Clostridia bacterium]|nr:adenine phosphoribosyltransferase [Clostridia bacterium]
MDLLKAIRTIPNFPKEGIEFFDITSVLKDPEAFKETIDRMYEALKDKDIDVIAALEARGFVFAAPLALKMGKSLALIRKKGKLPGETISASYSLEYGSAEIEMHTDSVEKGQNVVLIDDLLATGGTVNAAMELVEKSGGNTVACAFLIELLGLGGRELLEKKCSEIISLVTAKENI